MFIESEICKELEDVDVVLITFFEDMTVFLKGSIFFPIAENLSESLKILFRVSDIILKIWLIKLPTSHPTRMAI